MTIGTRLIIREETGGNVDQVLEVFDPGFRLSILMIILGVILIAAGAIIIARTSMKPLRKLTYTTLEIAQGNYSLPFGETKRTDDVGRLQNHYVKMQETVSAHMEQLKSLSQSEESRQQVLAETYAKTKEMLEGLLTPAA
jgi:nitrogen fixation/metabolism regulation signal transduction histidine kinase